MQEKPAANDRRKLVAVGLMLWPVLGMAGALLIPQYAGGMEGEFAAIEASPATWLAGEMLILLAFGVAGLSVLGLVPLLTKRGAVLGTIGAIIFALGSYFHGAVVGFALSEVPLVLSGRSTAELVELMDLMYNHVAFNMLLVPFLGFFIGQILLAIALWRGGIVRWWVATLMIVAPISEFVGPEAFSPELMLGMFVISYGWLGARLLRASITSAAVTRGGPAPVSGPVAN
jgi:hypothetical protein